MTRKCRLCLYRYFRRTPSWLVLVQCDASGLNRRPRDFPKIPRRRQQHHAPQCAARLRIRANLSRMFETDHEIW